MRSVVGRLADLAAAAVLIGGMVLIWHALRAIYDGEAVELSSAWTAAGIVVGPFLFIQLVSAVRTLIRGNRSVFTWTTVRLLFILMVTMWFAVVVSGQPFHFVRAYLAPGLSVGVLSVLLTLRLPLLGIVPHRPLRVADLVLTNVCLILVGSEIALRVASGLMPAPILVRDLDTAATNLVRFRWAPGRVHYGYKTNSGGHYDREFAPSSESRRIASIGDSFSSGIVPLPYHFSKVLEDQMADTRVFNLSCPAVGPQEYHYMLLNEALPLDPDVLLVNIFVGNDVQDVIEKRVDYQLLRSWFDPENVLICLAPVRAIAVLSERPKPPSGALAESRDKLPEMFPWVLDPNLEDGHHSEEAFLEIESRRARYLVREASAYEPLFHWLSEMRGAAREIPLVITLIPDEFQVEDPLWEQVSKRLPDLELDRFRHQRVIGAWLRDHDIPYLDLLPVLRSVKPLPDGKRHVYHLRDTHFNARGNRVAGIAMADFLAVNFGLERQVAAKNR